MDIEIKNLNKNFKNFEVIKNLNLSIKNINSLGIIGPSGSGKSTLLRILTGLIPHDSGEIYINSKILNFNDKSITEYRKSIGIVFQNYNLFPHLTALKNIILPLNKVHKIPIEVCIERATYYLKKFNLLEHKNKYPKAISGGQLQRISIIRTLCLNPKIIFLDEPTSALDPSFTKEVLNTILSLKDENKEYIIVTHELAFVKQSCEYIIFLENGNISNSDYTNNFFNNNHNNESLNNFINSTLTIN